MIPVAEEVEVEVVDAMAIVEAVMVAMEAVAVTVALGAPGAAVRAEGDAAPRRRVGTGPAAARTAAGPSARAVLKVVARPDDVLILARAAEEDAREAAGRCLFS